MSKTQEQIVKNQHYVPRCILSNFMNANNQVYEGLVSNKRIYLTNIANSMVERFTYEHSIFEVNFLEKYFSRIDSYLGPAIKNIIENIDHFKNGNTNFKSIQNLINKYMREFLIFYYPKWCIIIRIFT